MIGKPVPRRTTEDLQKNGGLGYSIEKNKIYSLYLRDL